MEPHISVRSEEPSSAEQHFAAGSIAAAAEASAPADAVAAGAAAPDDTSEWCVRKNTSNNPTCWTEAASSFVSSEIFGEIVERRFSVCHDSSVEQATNNGADEESTAGKQKKAYHSKAVSSADFDTKPTCFKWLCKQLATGSNKSDSSSQELQRSKLNSMLLLIITFSALTGLLMGYDLCVVGVVLGQIQKHFHLCGNAFSCSEKSLFVAILAPGAAVGSAFGGFLSDFLGRKVGLALSDFCLLVGSIILGCGDVFWLMLLGRFVLGLGVGMGFVVYATYTSEISPPDRRGQLVACQEVAQCFGCLIAYAVAAIYGDAAWRYLLGVAGFVAGFQILGEYWILPESPRYYMMKGQREKAAVSLRRIGIRKSTEIEEILFQFQRELQHGVHTHQNQHDSCCNDRNYDSDNNLRVKCGGTKTRLVFSTQHFRDSLSTKLQQMKKHRKPLLIAIGCAVAQNLTAANSVVYFSIDVFRLAGVCNPLVPGAGVGVVKFLGVLVCLYLVDRVGRRILLLVGTAGTLACHLLMLTGFALLEKNGSLHATAAMAAANCSEARVASVATWILIASLLVYIFFWNTSWAALMFVVASEVLPTALRGVGMGLTIMAFWILSFIMQYSFEALFTLITIPGTFSLLALLNVFSLLFVIFLVPEGKGKSLEDLHHTSTHAAGTDSPSRSSEVSAAGSVVAAPVIPTATAPSPDTPFPSSTHVAGATATVENVSAIAAASPTLHARRSARCCLPVLLPLPIKRAPDAADEKVTAPAATSATRFAPSEVSIELYNCCNNNPKGGSVSTSTSACTAGATGAKQCGCSCTRRFSSNSTRKRRCRRSSRRSNSSSSTPSSVDQQ